MFSITDLVRPETYFKILFDAVLMFTPTSLTTLDVVKSSASVKSCWFTSYWYSPTPIDLGSILTSSDSGSWIRLPIDTALRFSTAKSGNSSIASFDAL
jgi:hypothetical protein